MMGNTKQVRIHGTLVQAMERMRKEIAVEMKKHYGLKTVTIPDTFTSQVLAAKIDGRKTVSFKINKVTRDKGILSLI